MPGFSMPGADAFQEIVEECAKTPDGRKTIERQGGYETRDRRTLMQIGEAFFREVDAAFSAVVKQGGSPADYDAVTIGVGISKKTGVQSITIHFYDGFLRRESFEKVEYIPSIRRRGRSRYVKRGKHWIEEEKYRLTGERTGEGIRDIYALITSGYTISGQAWGHWDMVYGIRRAPYPQRQGTPFVPSVVKKYEEMYPGIKIEYPPEWG